MEGLGTLRLQIAQCRAYFRPLLREEGHNIPTVAPYGAHYWVGGLIQVILTDLRAQCIGMIYAKVGLQS